MDISERVMEAMRAGILLSDRVTTFIDKVDRMDQDIRGINNRLIRLETMAEIAKNQSLLPPKTK